METLQEVKSLPAGVAGYSEIWRKYVGAFRQFATATQEIRNEERAFLGAVEEYELQVQEADDKCLRELRNTIFERLVRDAERQFAVPGSHLKIARDEVAEQPFAQVDGFDPEALWHFLDEAYNTEEGKTASYLLATEALSHARELCPYRRRDNEPQETKVVSGRLVLTLPVYGDYRYNYSSRESLASFISALKCIAIWGGIWKEDDEEAVAAVLRQVHETRGDDPRCLGKLDFWSLVTLVSYKEKVEFRLDPALAEQVQVFLASYPIKSTD